MDIKKIETSFCSRKPFFLEISDQCFHWREYTRGENFNYSHTNQLIKNLKILPHEKNRISHRNHAIKSLGDEMASLKRLKDKDVFNRFTFIPIPPSKTKTHPKHNDKMLQILNYVKSYYYPSMDVRELIISNTDFEEDHKKDDSRSEINELIESYNIDTMLKKPIPDKIIIFDDVISAGRHFKAAKSILAKTFPEAKIIGLFIAKTINS